MPAAFIDPYNPTVLEDQAVPQGRRHEIDESLRAMSEDGPFPMWLADSEGRRFHFNSRWLALTGRTLEAESDDGWQEGLHGRDRERLADAYANPVLARRPFEWEYRLRRADGVYRWLLETGVPRWEADGQFSGYVGGCVDITDRRASREALRASRDEMAIILESTAAGITALDRNDRFRYVNQAAARLLGFATPEELLAVSWNEVMSRFELRDEADRPVPLSEMPSRRVLRESKPASITVRLRPLQGGADRWLTVRGTPVLDEAGQVDLALTMMDDITSLKRDEVSQRILAEAGRVLSQSIYDDRLAEELAQLLLPTVGEGCTIELRREDGSWLRGMAATSAAARGAFAESEGTGRSVLVTPIVIRGEELGRLSLARLPAQGNFSREELELIEELVRRIGLGWENARLYRATQDLNSTLEERVERRTAQLLAAQRQLEISQEQLRELSRHIESVREEERVRMAREIHDELGQALVGLNMDVAWLGRSLRRNLPAVHAKLRDMTARILDTVRSVRRISSELRPSILDDLGLNAALEWQLEDIQSRSGLRGTIESNLNPLRLDREQATAVFRIVQEALTNIVRHAGANRVEIRIDETPAAIRLVIQDDGRGIRPEELERSNSFGLLGMRERALLLGGQMEIQGDPGKGTRVEIRLPLQPEEER